MTSLQSILSFKSKKISSVLYSDWQIDIRPKAREAFKKLDKIAQRRIDNFIQKELRANPLPRNFVIDNAT